MASLVPAIIWESFFPLFLWELLLACAVGNGGFIGSSVAGILGVLIIILFLHDTPQSKGLPTVEVLTNEKIAPPLIIKEVPRMCKKQY